MTARAVLLGLAAIACGRIAVAQERGRCTIDGAHQINRKLPSGQYNSFFGGGVVARCPSKSVVLRADSLESYGDEGRIFFLGHVQYDEPRLSLTSDFLTYFQRDERIMPQGNVFARLPSGSTLRGPLAEYFRTIPASRPVPRLLASGRPTITLIQKDSTGQPAEPMTVLANAVTMVGDSLVYAGGQVLVTRENIVAHGDSMDLDSQREIVVMMRGPLIEGRKDRPFQLSGERIEMTSRLRKLKRVLSKGRAKAISQDMSLASDTIELRVADDLLQRAIAWGPSRARANSTAQQIVSDSIDVSMPGQRVHEMHAVRKAFAEGRPDSTRFHADTVDWMRGDTIVARFDTTAARDTTRAARLRQLDALGSARAYYHLAPSDTTLRRPGINYVVGREIVVDLQEQRVSKVTVIDQAAGIYLEPRAVAVKPDSTKAPRPTPAVPRRGAAPVRPPR